MYALLIPSYKGKSFVDIWVCGSKPLLELEWIHHNGGGDMLTFGKLVSFFDYSKKLVGNSNEGGIQLRRLQLRYGLE